MVSMHTLHVGDTFRCLGGHVCYYNNYGWRAEERKRQIYGISNNQTRPTSAQCRCSQSGSGVSLRSLPALPVDNVHDVCMRPESLHSLVPTPRFSLSASPSALVMGDATPPITSPAINRSSDAFMGLQVMSATVPCCNSTTSSKCIVSHDRTACS
jgi:hypothetical protein